MKKMLSGLLCFAMLFSMAACTSATGTNDTSESQSGEAEISQTEQNGDTITVTDMKGTVEIPANPQRIVDTSGSADELIILTSVEKVKINMDRPEEEELGEISVAQAKEYMEEGHFGKYNMYPKFRAAVEFLEKREGRSALITSFDKFDEALKGKTGTVIR
mgnify:CR=1 FL=1